MTSGTTRAPAWQLSKPVTGAKVVIRRTSKVVRTLDATGLGAALTPRWDGRFVDGTSAAAGARIWELTGAPEDGTGTALGVTGTLRVIDGA
ncbi:hypothetical protein [Streptomyces sp. NPDC048442]|uniref:hypothetical protein n=1 Tax=Streptomyces sp. NPDC048442 TaxID=3154823 RepID=UPI003418772A